MEVKLQQQLGWDKVSKARESTQEVKSGLMAQLDNVQREFASVAVDLAENLWGKIPARHRKPKSYRDQRYRIRKLRNMAEAVCTMVKLGTPPGVLFHKRLRELIASGVNPQIDIGNREAWTQWEQWAREEIRRIRHNTQVERRAFLGDR